MFLKVEKTMRILITGAKGQLGWEILRQAPGHACNCVGIDVEDADLTDQDQVDRVVTATRPNMLINTAAYTQVDAAQTDARSAFAVNRDAAAHLAAACAAAHVPLLHISTDFVFDGKKTEPYLEKDPVAPLSIYGQSKAAGEDAVRQVLDRHLIIRTAWLYGVHGNNFVKSMLRLGQKNQVLRVVSDQIGCPTSAADIAGALLTLCRRIQTRSPFPWGTYHLCGTGAVSWYDFARSILQIAHRLDMVPDATVIPITTEEYPTAAPRPAYSVLSCQKVADRFGIVCPPWPVSLETMLTRLSEHEQEQI
jgi:dTDP-4-dehydrorhamnose reductase